MAHRLAAVATAAITLSPALLAQTPAQLAEADALFNGLTSTTPGAAAVVVRDGAVVYRSGFGMADLDHGIPITPHTVFDVASVSKQFGGFAVASLVESGAIDLDAQVRDYLPELPDFGRSLTVRHLVHHISGIRDWPITLSVAGWRYDDVISFDQILRMAWSQRELNFDPGTEYSYSNTGYNLLAEIVQRVTGQSFRSWTDENVFTPLAMSSSHFHDDHREVVARRAWGYSPSADGGWTRSPNALTALGSSSLHSSVEDLARWLINYDTHVAGGDAVIERMRTRGILTSGDTIAYAYGINGIEWRGQRLYTHTGSWAGNRTVVMHFPELRSGVAVLANSGVYDPSPRARALTDIFLGDLLGPDDTEEAVSEGAARTGTPPPSLSAAQLEEYTGDWVSEELDTHYELSVIDGELVARHYRHGDIRLTPIERDVFTGNTYFFRPVRFERDNSGTLGDMFVGEGRARNLRFVRAAR